MKGILTVAIAVLLLCCIAASQAAEDNWRIKLMADDGLGGNSAPPVQLGVFPTADDAWDSVSDEEALYGVDTPGTNIWAVSRVVDDTRTMTKNIQSPASPSTYTGNTKVWLLRAAANYNNTSTEIRLRLFTISSTVLPPATVGGTPVHYYMILVDNKDAASGPAEWSVWHLDIPTTHSTNPFWTIPENMPRINLSAPTHAAMFAEGYNFRFVQSTIFDPEDYRGLFGLPNEVVPEPSGLLALGSSSLLGLIGFATRRRKA